MEVREIRLLIRSWVVMRDRAALLQTPQIVPRFTYGLARKYASRACSRDARSKYGFLSSYRAAQQT